MRNTKLARELRAFLNSPSAAVSLAPVSGSNHAAASGGNGILVDANQVVSLDPNAAGAGLTYGGGILAVGAGSGLTVGADSVALTTPGTLTAVTGNSAAGSHTHAITASADVSGDGAGVMNLLRTTAGGATVKTFTASLQVSTPKVISPASTNITLEPAGDITGKKVNLASGVGIGAHDYESQAKGWHITHAGAADFRYLFADEMHVKSFIADLEQALAGGQIIAKSVAVLYATFTAPAAGASTTLTVRDLPSATGMQVFVNGDFVRIRNFSRAGGSLTVADCWGTVTLDTSYGVSGFDSATKTQRFTFTRSAGVIGGANAPGGMSAGATVAPDAIILDYGTSGNGIYEVSAVDGAWGVNSPYAQVVTWTTHPKTGQVVNARFGKLSGVGGGANEFGIYAGTGTSTSHQWIRAGTAGVLQNNVAATWYKSGAKLVEIDADDGIQIVAHGTLDFLEQPRSYGFVDASGKEAGGLYATRASGSTSVVLTTNATYPAYHTLGHQIRVAADAPSGGTSVARLTARADVNSSELRLAIGGGEWNADLLARWIQIGAGGLTYDVYIGSTGAEAGIHVEPQAGGDWVTLNSHVGIGGAPTPPDRLHVYGKTIVDDVLDVNGAMYANSYSTQNWGSFNGGNIIIQYASAPYLGVSIKAHVGSAWTRSFGFNDGTNNLGGFGAYGPSGGLEHWYIGPAYGASSHVFVRNSDGFVGIGSATPAERLHVSGRVLAQGFRATVDTGGLAGAVSYTGTSLGVSTGTGTVKMGGSTARNSDLWLKIYVGTTAYFVPCWSNIS